MNESLRLKDQPVSERPRERLVARGPDALTHAELIAILLRTGLKGANVVRVAQNILLKFGSLNALALAKVDELRQIPGVGPDKAARLAELNRRATVRVAVDDPANVARLVRSAIAAPLDPVPHLKARSRRSLRRVTALAQGW